MYLGGHFGRQRGTRTLRRIIHSMLGQLLDGTAGREARQCLVCDNDIIGVRLQLLSEWAYGTMYESCEAARPRLGQARPLSSAIGSTPELELELELQVVAVAALWVSGLGHGHGPGPGPGPGSGSGSRTRQTDDQDDQWNGQRWSGCDSGRGRARRNVTKPSEKFNSTNISQSLRGNGKRLTPPKTTGQVAHPPPCTCSLIKQ